MKKVFTWNKLAFYGAPASEVTDLADVVILLTEAMQPLAVNVSYIGFTQKMLRMLPKPKQPRIVHVPITDFSAPRVSAAFWKQLVSALNASAKKELNVCVCCQGGIGRTGTVLALLAGALGVTKKDPVQYIRKCYRPDAVETSSQIEYLKRELQIPIEAKPAKAMLEHRVVGTTGVSWDDVQVSGRALSQPAKRAIFGAQQKPARQEREGNHE